MEHRYEAIEKLAQNLGQTRFSIDHVYKGPHGSRVLTDMAIVEFTSNSVRESVLKVSEGKPLQDQNRAELKIDRAKSASQLSRNAFLRKAMDDLKKSNSSETVEIVWLKGDRTDKSRDVTVGGVPAFRQETDDLKGIFLAPFRGTV